MFLMDSLNKNKAGFPAMVNKPSSGANLPVPTRLRALRRAEGYDTAKQFAEVLGVSANRYGNIEAGSGLSIEIAQRIVASVPGCSLDWLYNGIENGLSVSLRQRLHGGGTEPTTVKATTRAGAASRRRP
jgi:hypothetical protein